jgi:hypothetical protein
VRLYNKRILYKHIIDMKYSTTNQQMIDQYFENTTHNKQSTMELYKQQLKSMVSLINFKSRQPTIIKFFKKEYQNPNTQSNKLNILILVRVYHKLKTDMLKSYRDEVFKLIDTLRKKNLKELSENVISYDELLEKLDLMNTKWYMLNYMYIHFGLRNKDLNAKVITEEPTDEDENYIRLHDDKITFYINHYKTSGIYKQKKLMVDDEKFINIFKKMEFKNNDYLFSKPDGSKYPSSSWNTISARHSIDKLGEVKIMKILTKHFIDNKDYSKLTDIQNSRGSSLGTIMKSYNLYNI